MVLQKYHREQNGYQTGKSSGVSIFPSAPVLVRSPEKKHFSLKTSGTKTNSVPLSILKKSPGE
eukprot:4344189-Amphidinium_carterae.1